jgi:hypothetical protein
MYCYVRNALPRVRLVSLVRTCYVFLLPCHLGSIVIVQPFLQKKVLFVLLMKKTPRPNNLEFSNWNLKKIFMLVLVFSNPCVFYPEVAPTQLADPHCLTASQTETPLCTWLCQKNCCLVSSCANPIKAMFLSIDPVPKLYNISIDHPSRSCLPPLLSHGSGDLFPCESCCGFRIPGSFNDSAPLSGYLL